MRIGLYATLRKIAGTSHAEITVESGETVLDVLNALVERFPGLGQEFWDEEGSLANRIAVILNGRDISHLDGIETQVSSEDSMDVFPPVGGG